MQNEAKAAPKGPDVDVAIVGGGPAGLLAAVLIADAGIPTALIAPAPPPDNRTTALMQGSLGILRGIGLWPALQVRTGALRCLRILDDTNRLMRAGETVFRAEELGHPAFGHNIENAVLVDALATRAAALPALTIVRDAAVAVLPASPDATIELADGAHVRAKLVIGADGRNSPCRTAAGITTVGNLLPQSALTVNVEHTLAHDETSTEFHTPSGPFTLVPLPGYRSSLVLVERPEVVDRLRDFDPAALGAELTRRSHGLLGAMTPLAPAFGRRLENMQAARFARRRIALIGEAAHVLPPIGAQGLNLGFRDAAEIATLAIQALAKNADPGSDTVLGAYDRARRGDAALRGRAVNLLNRSLLSDLIPAQIARSAGLWALRHLPPVRRAVMQQGIATPAR